MHWVLSQTRFGQYTYALGGNRIAAVRAGHRRAPPDAAALHDHRRLRRRRRHDLHGPLLGRCGAGRRAAAARFSIAAVVIGGASLFGGSGTIIGTVIGALIIAVIQYGLVFINVEPFWQFVAVGIVIIVSVLIDQSRTG